MKTAQPGILAAVPPQARYLQFSLVSAQAAPAVLRQLAAAVDGDATVAGLGLPLLQALGWVVEGLTLFPVQSGPGIEIPSTPAALWLWLRGKDRGELVHRTRQFEALLAPAFTLAEVIDAFYYDGGRDLSGYVDGTENPTGARAVKTAFVAAGDGLAGSSFVAVQQWLHDLDAFQALPPKEQDNTFGRRRADNTEIARAPASAHVKRTAQEDFDPAAFVLRRSMPWADDAGEGLVFVAFAASFRPFEVLLARMLGKDDGITDALFHFTRPLTGAYFWCPPLRQGKLDLRAIGL